MTNPAAIGIDVGGTYIKGGLVDQNGNLIFTASVPTGDRAFSSVCNTMAAFIQNDFFARKPADLAIAGVGVAVPGGIYNDKATISESPNFPGWKDVNLAKGVAERGVSNILIDNDANMAALGESWVGAGKDANSMIIFTLGTGVGGGVILNKQVWSGCWGMGGELGHITIYPQGRQCGCGNLGCLEQYASGTAILAEAERLREKGLTPELETLLADAEKISPRLVYEAAKAGDTELMRLFEEVGLALGIAAADLLNILNPELFVIGGGVGASFDLLEAAMKSEMKRRAFRIPAQNVKIRKATLGNDAGVIGAAKLVFQRLTM